MLCFCPISPSPIARMQNHPVFPANSSRLLRFSFVFAIAFFLPNFQKSSAFAGATASNWVVVVNGDSLNSRTIANVYCSARNIPSRNVIVLTKIPDSDQITVDQFRELILTPVLKEIEVRGLTSHIQGIAYSADFPTAVAIGTDIDAVPNKSPYLTPVGSINGLTYLFRFVLAKNPSYIGFDCNLYATRPPSQLLRPLTSNGEQAKELADFLSQMKHEEAAKLLDTICETLDKELLYPMQYLAAQQWALAGDSKLALKRIEKSIQGGWAYRSHLLEDPAFVSLVEDKDFKRIAKRAPELPFDYLPSRGFDARTFYNANTLGSSNPQLGVSYMLSMVLAVTRDLGISQFEAKQNLLTSVRADFSHPKGAFYFTKTEDVRTKTREPNFAIAINRLQSKGFTAHIVEKDLPPRGAECSGVMFGTPQFQWNESGAKLLPGSIADNLTSLGGAMTTTSQTKATELLRFGAAASSGAVTEPYSIQQKFPHPMIHVHYVDGLTTAEAFYSSVLCPYQLLIVGDPLCQPYCNPPRFTIETKNDKDLDNKPMVLTLQTEESQTTTEPEVLQGLLDGLLRTQDPFDPNLQMRFNKSDIGAHEIRLITKAAKPIEQRFEQAFWITIGKENEQISLVAPKNWQFRDGKPLVVSVTRKKEFGEIKIVHNFEAIGTLTGNDSSLEISPSKIGYGPVRLHAEYQLSSGQAVRSLPAVVQVEL